MSSGSFNCSLAGDQYHKDFPVTYTCISCGISVLTDLFKAVNVSTTNQGVHIIYLYVEMTDAVIYFPSDSLSDYLEKNDSTSESVVWEFLLDLSLVSA